MMTCNSDTIKNKLEKICPWAFQRIKEMEILATECLTYHYNPADQDNYNFEDWSQGSFSGRFFAFQLTLVMDNAKIEKEIEEARLKSASINSGFVLFTD